ncbi:MAG: HmuY family protein [Bacteroidetes bacterium]|nr:HmuY family protein [Bacteroidota bacterium]
MNYLTKFFLIALSIAFLESCKSSDPAPVTLTGTTVKDLAADPPSGGYNPTNGQPIGVTRKYTLFNFKTGAIIANADSATAKWDIGFNGTTIIVNGGTSGPGNASALVFTGLFDDLSVAPDGGYAQDNKNSTTAPYAIPRGSGKGWYLYDPATNIITPKAGVVLVFKTADAKYAKAEILSYYKGAPAAPSNTTPDRYYTFRYLYQADGSTKLK